MRPFRTPMEAHLPHAYLQMMIRDPRPLRELDERFERERLASLGFRDALARFEALWRQARLLNPEIGDDWRADLEPDVAIARAVNGLPPAP